MCVFWTWSWQICKLFFFAGNTKKVQTLPLYNGCFIQLLVSFSGSYWQWNNFQLHLFLKINYIGVSGSNLFWTLLLPYHLISFLLQWDCWLWEVIWIWHLCLLPSMILTPDPSQLLSSAFLFHFHPLSYSFPWGFLAKLIILYAPGSQARSCLFSFFSGRTSNLGEREGEQMTNGSWPFLPRFNSSLPCPLNVAIKQGRSDTLIWAWSGLTHNHCVTFHLYIRPWASGSAQIAYSEKAGGQAMQRSDLLRIQLKCGCVYLMSFNTTTS